MTMNEHPATTRARRFYDHVLALGDAFGVTVHEAKEVGTGFAMAQKNIVVIAAVTDDVSYAIALHELGHCLHPLGHVHRLEGSLDFRRTGQPSTLRDVSLKLVAERAAWEWARQFALEWNEQMDFIERHALASYVKNARRYGIKEG